MTVFTFYKEVHFKETRIGRMPEDWAISRLGDVISEAKSGFASGRRDPNGITQLRMDNIDPQGNIRRDAGVTIPIPKDFEDYLLQPGDILFNNTNSVDMIGKTAIFQGEFSRCVYSNHLTRIRVDSSKAIPQWILFLLMRKWQLDIFKAICHRHVHQAGINVEDLLNLEIPVPSPVEQRKIVGGLGVVDSALGKTGEVIAKIERLKKGLMQELLTKGIGHKEYKQTPVGKIPKEWAVTSIGEECLVGTGGTPSRSNSRYFGGNVSWVKSTEVNYNIITKTEETLTESGMQNSNAKLYPKGSLIVALYGQGITRGKCAILGIDAAINQACAALQSKGRICIPYLSYWFQNSYANIRRLSQGANQANLNMEIIRSLKVPLPSIPEQQKIAEILSTLDEKLKLEKNEKAKLEHVKRGLMGLLLTGEVRVKM